MSNKGEVPAFPVEEEDNRKVSELQFITRRPASGRVPVSAVRVTFQKMENKINGRMSNANTSIADSTDARQGDLIEAGYSNPKLPNESQSLIYMSSSVRNFANGGTVIHGPNSSGEGVLFKECKMLDDSLVAKHFYGRNSEYLKCDSVAPWDDFANVQGTNVAPSESLPEGSLSLSSAAGACKFIKDEKEPSVIMDTACPSFDPSSDIHALDSCCDTNRKQQLGLDGESTSFPPGAAGPRSPNFLMDLSQSEQLQAQGQVRTDPRCGFSGKPVINFEANKHSGLQLTMYRNEVPRWQTQASPADPPYWCQTGVTEDPFIHSGYDGIQNHAVTQRNPSPFSAFPG